MAVFKDRFKELRSEKGLTQVDVAKYLGVKHQTISFYETGREPDYDKLSKLADYFDVSTDYLVGRTDFKNYENKNLEDIIFKDLDIEELDTEQMTMYKEFQDVYREFLIIVIRLYSLLGNEVESTLCFYNIISYVELASEIINTLMDTLSDRPDREKFFEIMNISDISPVLVSENLKVIIIFLLEDILDSTPNISKSEKEFLNMFIHSKKRDLNSDYDIDIAKKRIKLYRKN